MMENKKEYNTDATKQSWQYCSRCKEDTYHTPKLGLVFSNKRLCAKCNQSNTIDEKD